MNKSDNITNNNEDIINLFKKIKPLLDEGKSYSQSLKIIKKSNSNYTDRWWFKRLIEYGESQGYPYDYYQQSHTHKFGLLNVTLNKHKCSSTGYYWVYKYYDDNYKKKLISDNDLRDLRKIVEEKKLTWKVTHLERAKKAYELNKKLQLNKKKVKKKGRRNTVGVKYVSKHFMERASRGFYWIYRPYPPKSKSAISSISLKKLKEKVINKGMDWIVIDENKYNENLQKDEEELKQGKFI